MDQAWHDMTATALGAAIGTGEIDPVALAEHFLTRIAADDTDHRIYLRTTADRALAEAEAAKARADEGLRRGPLDGVPISWKDLYDTAGVATEGGTPLLKGRVPTRDAVVLERATRAGLVCLGKTNTVQFALGGVGSNPYTGTPANAAARDEPRAPGGSSCGAAVSVATGLASAGIGSDTGGSVRIPAAWNNLVGLKTTIGALPLDGVLPLAPGLDTAGPLTKSVADAAHLFAVMAEDRPVDLTGATVDGMAFLACESVVWDGADEVVAKTVRGAIQRLEAAGARIEWRAVPEFDEMHNVLNSYGGTVTAEGYATWRDQIDNHPDQIDPNVLSRFLQGRDMSAPDVEAVRAAVRSLTPALYRRMAGYHAVLAPTVPIVPPPLSEVEASADAYSHANMMALRNTRLGNMLPCCALTVPCPGAAMPAGLMLMGPADADRAILRTGAAVDATLAN